MADRCVFFDDLLTLPNGAQRTYEVRDRGLGIICIDARMRCGPDWFFARRWVRSAPGARELHRTLDRLEMRGFRFHVQTALAGGPTFDEMERAARSMDEVSVRASAVAADYSDEERRLHEELFPQEHELLVRGYDWDKEHVYRVGQRLPRDAYGRIVEVDEGVVHEWVRVPQEFTWRRYPIGRVAPPARVSTWPESTSRGSRA